MQKKTSPSRSPSSKDSPTLKAALNYARQGVRVFPTHWPEPKRPGKCSCGKPDCKSPGKHPLTPNGFKDATTHEKQIRRWWKARPKANVAAVPGEHEFVVDVDPRNGGAESLQDLEREFGPFTTRRYRTGSGGLHLWFKAETPVRGHNAVSPGIDIKSSSGYVLMPPSLHVKGRYEVIDDREPTAAPSGLVDLIDTRSGHGTSDALTPDQLRAFAAPGNTEEERLRWVRDAVKAIPNDARFDGREPWVGMAHAIRTACGEGLESEAFEIFDRFSERYEGRDYDPDVTRHVWETLGVTRSSRGYHYLLRLAQENGHQLPPDHPWSAQREFEADLEEPAGADQASAAGAPEPRNVDDLLRELAYAPIASLPGLFRACQTRWSSLDPLAARLAQAGVKAAFARRFGSAEAFRALSSPSEEPFEAANGRHVIRAADPRDLDVDCASIVNGMIPAGTIGEVIADYGCGKTWLMLDLGLSVAFGQPFFGLDVQKRPVLYLAYEGQFGLWKRIAGWMHHHGYLPAVSTTTDLHALLSERLRIAKTPPLFDHPDIEAGLLDTVRALQVGLVIIDTRNKSLGGDQSEESNDTAGHVNGMLSRIAAATGCAVVSTHHVGHANRERGRGASAWTQGVDFSFLIQGTAAVMSNGGIMTLKPHKVRDDAWPAAFRYRLTKSPELQVNGQTWNSAYLEGADEPAAVRDFAPLSTRVLWFVEENPGCSAEKIRKGVQGKNKEIDAKRERLVRQGALENRGRTNRHSYYVVPGWQTMDEDEELDSEGAFADTLGDAGESVGGEA